MEKKRVDLTAITKYGYIKWSKAVMGSIPTPTYISVFKI